jgi:hypothetical protein
VIRQRLTELAALGALFTAFYLVAVYILDLGH